MIFSDREILACIEHGMIIIEPFDKKYLNPNSVDLTLNPKCKIYKSTVSPCGSEDYNLPYEKVPAVLDCRKPNEVEEFEIPEEGYVLQPGILYLYSCNEKIGVPAIAGNEYRRICARVEGKSSLARLGLFVHITAGWIDTGFVGSLVLELHCVQPLRIYPNQKICQICFMQVYGAVLESYGEKIGSKYMNQEGVQESKMHENWIEANEKVDGLGC